MLSSTGAGGAVARTSMGVRLFGRRAVLSELRSGAMLCVSCRSALVKCSLYVVYSVHLPLTTAP